MLWACGLAIKDCYIYCEKYIRTIDAFQSLAFYLLSFGFHLNKSV